LASVPSPGWIERSSVDRARRRGSARTLNSTSSSPAMSRTPGELGESDRRSCTRRQDHERKRPLMSITPYLPLAKPSPEPPARRRDPAARGGDHPSAGHPRSTAQRRSAPRARARTCCASLRACVCVAHRRPIEWAVTHGRYDHDHTLTMNGRPPAGHDRALTEPERGAPPDHERAITDPHRALTIAKPAPIRADHRRDRARRDRSRKPSSGRFRTAGTGHHAPAFAGGGPTLTAAIAAAGSSLDAYAVFRGAITTPSSGVTAGIHGHRLFARSGSSRNSASTTHKGSDLALPVDLALPASDVVLILHISRESAECA
jgi:hypothetical protein